MPAMMVHPLLPAQDHRDTFCHLSSQCASSAVLSPVYGPADLPWGVGCKVWALGDRTLKDV